VSVRFSIVFVFTLLCATAVLVARETLQSAFGAEENYLLVKSLDSSILHLADESEKEEYKSIIEIYLQFKNLHIQGRYSESYLQMRKTQLALTKLYEKILKKNIEVLKEELSILGKKSRGKEKWQTKAFQRLALRDIAEAEQKLLMAQNTRPYLYLLKLRDMLFSLKILKHAGRFVVFLHLLHNGMELEEIESTEFDSIESEIKRSFGKEASRYLKIHYDNHYLPYPEDSIYESVMNDFKAGQLKNDSF
jgi:hypothetical protein